MDRPNNFQPHQILYLQHDRDRLYVELIQQIVSRRMYWSRPLALVTDVDWYSAVDHYQPAWEANESAIHDLRQAPDLLWPALLFQPALDTEVIPLLSTLYASEAESPLETAQIAHQRLRHFMNQIWAAAPEAFQA
jgi:hypothetical protein